MTRNDHSDDRYLGFTFETEKAIRVLTDLRDLGYVHVSIRGSPAKFRVYTELS